MDLDGMIDVSPDVHFVNSMRNRNLGWEKALAELIDNAIDHRANQVKILANNKTVVVVDDGAGVAFGEFDDASTLGEYDDLGSKITLNKEHPFVEHLRKNKEMKEALHAVAFSLICHWAVSNKGNQKLLFESEDFGLVFGKVLANLDIKEPEDAKA